MSVLIIQPAVNQNTKNANSREQRKLFSCQRARRLGCLLKYNTQQTETKSVAVMTSSSPDATASSIMHTASSHGTRTQDVQSSRLFVSLSYLLSRVKNFSSLRKQFPLFEFITICFNFYTYKYSSQVKLKMLNIYVYQHY